MTWVSWVLAQPLKCNDFWTTTTTLMSWRWWENAYGLWYYTYFGTSKGKKWFLQEVVHHHHLRLFSSSLLVCWFAFAASKISTRWAVDWELISIFCECVCVFRWIARAKSSNNKSLLAHLNCFTRPSPETNWPQKATKEANTSSERDFD